MTDFTYTARNRAGGVEKGVMSMLNERAVAEALRSQGLLPTQIRPASRSIDFKAIMDSFGSIKLLDKITFIKNLSVMIRAGLPVSRSLRILTVQTPNAKFSKVIADISRQVEGGTSLADAMTKHPKVFSNIFVSMVHVGEVSGNLEQNLGYLSDQMQRDYELMSKAKGAMTYPVIVLVALAIVGFLMFTLVLPKLTSTFVDLKVQLPFMTRVVVGLVDIFAHYGIFILIAFIGGIIGFLSWRKTDSGKKVIHKAVLYMPVFAPIVVKINLARFLRVLSSLIKSGMSIVEALDVAGNVVGNIYYQKIIKEAAQKVKIGSPMTSAFKKNQKLFSHLVVQMMEVGEESGTTDAVLAEVASFYEAEVDQTMKNLSSILEPVIMMVIGTVVGFLAVALVTPIYSITQSIG
ncbi:MAG: type II secretion system F family protein [Candidatus Doudnabacteria bacterium]|nr:type II secretion system F family protein [Candidatus Doudnabacteria bacterium]